MDRNSAANQRVTLFAAGPLMASIAWRGMRNYTRGLLVGAITLSVAAAGCGSGPGQSLQPSLGADGASSAGVNAASGSAPATSPAADLSDFDSRFAAAVEAARKVPLDGAPFSEIGLPTCQAIGQPTEPPRLCLASFPATDPVVTISANATGSMGATGMMMAMASMPDGIEGTILPAPALGDAASLARSWSAGGCTGVLAVRDGTLIVSVQVLLATSAAASDCGLDVPTDYLEAVARILLDNLGAFGSVGMPSDDAAARDRVARLITDGTLRPGDRDLVTLPPEFANLSDGGEVVAMRDGQDWTIVFFEVRGVIDHYSGWVFRSSGKLGADEDPLAGGSATVVRIDDHWFHVVAS